MRDYLRRLYGVETLRIRSYVEQQKVTRLDRSGKGLGPLRRPLSKKKMTVEMTEPFVWPDPPEDMSPYVLSLSLFAFCSSFWGRVWLMGVFLCRWEQDRFFKTQKYEKDYRQKSQPDSAMEPDTEARKAYEAAAKEMKETKEKKTWSPTWQALGLNYNPVDLAKRFGGGPKS